MSSQHIETRVTATQGVLAVMACSNRRFARHSHAQYGFGTLDAGGQRSVSGRGTVEAAPGDIITVNPAEVHDGAPLAGSPRRWRMLYFDESVLQAAASGLADDASAAFEFHAPVWRDPCAVPLFDNLFGICSGGRGDRTDAMLKEECLLRLLGRLGEPRRKREAGIAGSIVRAKAAIDTDPAHAFTLAELAALGGMNPFQTIRMFARATGFTPHAYLMQRRVELARDLIRGGSGLADAAMTAGFSDQSHLTRAFSARFGYTPGVYASAFS